MLDKEHQEKIKSKKLAKGISFEVLQKRSSIMPHVDWAEESKTGLGFKI